MRVAVLGGGLQGCCAAAELASKGVSVELFDLNPSLLSRTAVANEGKIHLGYMYAADPTLATAKAMMRGALAFDLFFQRHLGANSDRALETSEPAIYGVHRESQHGPEKVSRYFDAVHALIVDEAKKPHAAYFNADFSARPRQLSRAEVENHFDPATVLAAFSTQEVAINPLQLAARMRNHIEAQPLIKLRLSHMVRGAEARQNSILVHFSGKEGELTERFDHVVNALWDGRLALDETMGIKTGRPWLYRLKYGVSVELSPQSQQPPSATFISGPFGEVVNYQSGLTYLTWYPDCMRGLSSGLRPPEWLTYPEEPLRSQIVKGTFAALSKIVPALQLLDPDNLPGVTVKGGVIVAWGSSDIDDPSSELHTRHDIGVHSSGRFHSINTGKLTMAPLFAEVTAARVVQRV